MFSRVIMRFFRGFESHRLRKSGNPRKHCILSEVQYLRGFTMFNKINMCLIK